MEEQAFPYVAQSSCVCKCGKAFAVFNGFAGQLLAVAYMWYAKRFFFSVNIKDEMSTHICMEFLMYMFSKSLY